MTAKKRPASAATDPGGVQSSQGRDFMNKVNCTTVSNRVATAHEHEGAYIALADIFELAGLVQEAADIITYFDNLPPAANAIANRIETLARVIRDAAMAGAERGGRREAAE